LIVVSWQIQAQSTPKIYNLFSKYGSLTTYDRLLEDITPGTIILFGELHNDPIAHWLQKRLCEDILDVYGNKLVVGMEMLETDDQLVVNEYLDGFIDYKKLKSAARLWSHFEPDYRPVLDLAKEAGIKVIASNIPRRYASMVYAHGLDILDSLPESSQEYIAPITIPYDSLLPGYQSMLEMSMGHGGANLPKAQAVKDATMAHRISQHWRKDGVFLHLNGAFHSDNFDGIYWYLNQYIPEPKILTISTVNQADVMQLKDDNQEIADYILNVVEDMTKTH
jgi:uncharacterized iron-regulated protein